jgi:hypothetical protein
MLLAFSRPIWFFLFVIAISGCDTSAPEAPSAKKQVALKVADANGVATEIHPDETTKVFAVASWCPHTKSFIRAINDEQVRQELKEYNLVFVLEADEWPAVRSQLKAGAVDGKIQGIPVEPALKRLKKRAGNGPLFDPEFLDSLPGKYYFLPVNYPMKAGFPSVYSSSLEQFSGHAMDWVEKKSSRALSLYHKFERETDNQ